jgi:putative ABC transport system substrate-binding protein
MISRRTFLTAASMLSAPCVSRAQAAKGALRIGLLRLGAFPPSFIEPFRQELRTLGYVEGESIFLEYRIAQNQSQLSAFATELVRLKVDLLVASGAQAVLAARNVTSTTPLVFVAAMDPVAMGVVASLARPGGNITGVTGIQPEITGKRLALLKELLPDLSRVAFLVAAGSPLGVQYVKDAEAAASTLGIKIQVLTVRGSGDLEGAFNAAQGASALVQGDDSALSPHQAQLAALALKNHLPTMSGLIENVEAGELMAYGPQFSDLYRLAARQVHKVLNGAKPADLPVEQPTKFELAINLRTARVLGLAVPQSLLQRADEVIK